MNVSDSRSNLSNVLNRTIEAEWSESTYHLVGTLMAALALKGLMTSLLFFKILVSNTKHINSSFAYIPVLIGLAFILSVGVLPLNIVSAFDGRFTLNRKQCNAYGFIITWLGLMFISALTVMVVQSYRILTSRHIIGLAFKKRSFLCLMVACNVTCCIAAGIPLFGIGEYAPLVRPALCHFKWTLKNPFDIVYFTVLLVVFFLLPSTIIIVLYAIIVKKVKISVRRSGQLQNRMEKLIRTSIMITVSFIITWTPYVTCAIMDLAEYNYRHVAPSLHLLSSICAKISFTWLPAIVIFRHRHYKNDILQFTEDVAEKITETIAASSQEYDLDKAAAIDRGVVALHDFGEDNLDLQHHEVVLIHYASLPDE